MNDTPIFQIHLHWQRLHGSPLLAVRADGLMNSQLRHYGRRAGLRRVSMDDDRPAMVGTVEQRDALLCELERAGYIIHTHVRTEDFAFNGDEIAAVDPSREMGDIADEWLNLPGEPSDTVAHELLIRATAEDPFASSHLDDCLPAEGITPSALSRYERASTAYLAACHSEEQDNEAQEIHRLIATYWLKKSRAFWLD